MADLSYPDEWDEMFKDEPGPPTAWDEYYAELLEDFEWIVRHPRAAVRGFDSALEGFCRDAHGLCGVWPAVKSDDVLERQACIDLMQTMTRAYTAAAAACPSDFDRNSLIQGFRGMQALILVWAEPPSQREQRPRQDLWIAWDYVRILDHEFRKAGLKQGIAGMARDRRQSHNDAIVESLKRQAGAA